MESTLAENLQEIKKVSSWLQEFHALKLSEKSFVNQNFRANARKMWGNETDNQSKGTNNH